MASGIRPTTNNQLEIYIEKPFGGVASNADAVDIQDNQFVSCQGVLEIDSKLCQVNVVAPPTSFKFNPRVANAIPCVIFNLMGALYAVDQFGNLYVYGSGVGPVFPTSFNFLIQASDAPWVLFARTRIVVQVLNGIAYIAVPDRNAIYTFNGSGSFALASNYTGGNVLGVLDDYLLQMNTNSAVDGIQPTRVNWSAPGAFSTWDPSVNRAAGFDTLVNIEDAITGFISLASVGIIIGEKGLVEASPTGVGTQPFSFTSLWTSEVGQGCLYPDTVAQYGQNSYLGTDTGIYKISTSGGFQPVDGAARTAILGPVQESSSNFPNLTADAPPFFAGNILLYAYNSTYPTPHYVFVETTPQVVPNSTSNMIIWFLNLETGAWFNIILPLDSLVNQQNGTTLADGTMVNLKIASVQTLGFDFGDALNNLPNLLIYGGVQYLHPSVQTQPFVASLYIFNKANLSAPLNTPSSLNIVTKAWEMKLGRQPTIRRVIIKAYGSGTLTCSVNGIPFGNITLDGTTIPKVYKTPQGIRTGLDPQLTITSSNFQGVIIKMMLAGTYADGDID